MASRPEYFDASASELHPQVRKLANELVDAAVGVLKKAGLKSPYQPLSIVQFRVDSAGPDVYEATRYQAASEKNPPIISFSPYVFGTEFWRNRPQDVVEAQREIARAVGLLMVDQIISPSDFEIDLAIPFAERSSSPSIVDVASPRVARQFVADAVARSLCDIVERIHMNAFQRRNHSPSRLDTWLRSTLQEIAVDAGAKERVQASFEQTCADAKKAVVHWAHYENRLGSATANLLAAHGSRLPKFLSAMGDSGPRIRPRTLPAPMPTVVVSPTPSSSRVENVLDGEAQARGDTLATKLKVSLNTFAERLEQEVRRPRKVLRDGGKSGFRPETLEEKRASLEAEIQQEFQSLFRALAFVSPREAANVFRQPYAQDKEWFVEYAVAALMEVDAREELRDLLGEVLAPLPVSADEVENTRRNFVGNELLKAFPGWPLVHYVDAFRESSNLNIEEFLALFPIEIDQAHVDRVAQLLLHYRPEKIAIEQTPTSIDCVAIQMLARRVLSDESSSGHLQIDPLLEVLMSTPAEVADTSGSILTIGESSNVKALDYLAGVLADEDASVVSRMYAFQALVAHDDPAIATLLPFYANLLDEAFRHSSLFDEESTFDIIATLGDRTLVSSLIALMDGHALDKGASKALAHIDKAAAQQAVFRLWHSEDGPDRTEYLLQAIGIGGNRDDLNLLLDWVDVESLHPYTRSEALLAASYITPENQEDRVRMQHLAIAALHSGDNATLSNVAKAILNNPDVFLVGDVLEAVAKTATRKSQILQDDYSPQAMEQAGFKNDPLREWLDVTVEQQLFVCLMGGCHSVPEARESIIHLAGELMLVGARRQGLQILAAAGTAEDVPTLVKGLEVVEAGISGVQVVADIAEAAVNIGGSKAIEWLETFANKIPTPAELQVAFDQVHGVYERKLFTEKAPPAWLAPVIREATDRERKKLDKSPFDDQKRPDQDGPEPSGEIEIKPTPKRPGPPTGAARALPAAAPTPKELPSSSITSSSTPSELPKDSPPITLAALLPAVLVSQPETPVFRPRSAVEAISSAVHLPTPLVARASEPPTAGPVPIPLGPQNAIVKPREIVPMGQGYSIVPSAASVASAVAGPEVLDDTRAMAVAPPSAVEVIQPSKDPQPEIPDLPDSVSSRRALPSGHEL